MGTVCRSCIALGVMLCLSSAVRADLVSHFSFDGDLLDPISGNDGTFVGADTATFVDGYDGTPGGAVMFDGVDDFVNVAQVSNLPLNEHPAFSVAMWVKAPPQADKRVFSEGSSSSNTPLYNIGSDNSGNTGALDIYIRSDAGTSVGHFKTGRDAFDDTWHHIAVVDAEGAITLYIDGVREGGGVTYDRVPLNTDTTTIGGILRASSCCLLTGVIDDVRLYNHALAAEEVEALVPVPEDCPAEGDTTCGSLAVAGPEGGGPGPYTLTATDVNDESGDDPLYYIFSGESDAGDSFYVGPQTSNEATVTLAAGNWTLTATVDDNILCRDTAGSCGAEVDVVAEPPRLVSHWPFDGTLEDVASDNEGMYLGVGDPLFGTGYDCTPSGAGRFNGVDALVRAETNDALPIYNSPSYSVAMWVNGPPDQRDMRVFSESNTQGNNSPLLNIGTDSTDPPAGLVDIYIRGDDGSAVANHIKSTGVAFDNTWHHIAWVDDNGAAVLYIDGVQDATDFTYTRGLLSVDSTTIGGILRGSPSHWFTGRIDDVKVFNYALSADEAAELGSGPPPECEPELPQIQGDCNQDGAIDVADILCSIGISFPGFDLLNRSAIPLPCEGDAASAGNLAVLDLNGDGAANHLDGVYLSNYLFRGGSRPPQGIGCFTILESAGCGANMGCQ